MVFNMSRRPMVLESLLSLLTFRSFFVLVSAITVLLCDPCKNPFPSRFRSGAGISFGLCVAGELLARLNVWILSDTLFVLHDVRKNDLQHPANIHLGFEHVESLARIAAEIEDHRKLRGYDRL